MAAHIVPIMSAPKVAASSATHGTDQVTVQMGKVSIEQAAATSTATQRTPIAGTQVRITVPLDATPTALYSDRKLLRRDSLERREAFLKGKEGSRQRRRWENGTEHIPRG
jgi:hypothetical protein